MKSNVSVSTFQHGFTRHYASMQGVLACNKWDFPRAPRSSPFSRSLGHSWTWNAACHLNTTWTLKHKKDTSGEICSTLDNRTDECLLWNSRTALYVQRQQQGCTLGLGLHNDPKRADRDHILFVSCTTLSLSVAVCSSHQLPVQQLWEAATATPGAQKASLAFRVTELQNPTIPKTCSRANRLGDTAEDKVKEEGWKYNSVVEHMSSSCESLGSGIN